MIKKYIDLVKDLVIFLIPVIGFFILVALKK